MNITKILKEYKGKKAIVENAEVRIETWEYALAHPELWENVYFSPGRTGELGMPLPPLRSNKSPVELSLEYKEITSENIKEWIREEESRIIFTKLEVMQIENAINGLTQWEKYIIECKYFEGMAWRSVEINFNDKFKQKNDLTEERIKQINREAIKKVENILKMNVA